MTREVINYAKVQLEETKDRQQTQSLVTTSVENFILENVGSELTLVSTVDKKNILPEIAKIQGRKMALQ